MANKFSKVNVKKCVYLVFAARIQVSLYDFVQVQIFVCGHTITEEKLENILNFVVSWSKLNRNLAGWNI